MRGSGDIGYCPMLMLLIIQIGWLSVHGAGAPDQNQRQRLVALVGSSHDFSFFFFLSRLVFFVVLLLLAFGIGDLVKIPGLPRLPPIQGYLTKLLAILPLDSTI